MLPKWIIKSGQVCICSAKRKSHQYLSAHNGRFDLSHFLFFASNRIREIRSDIRGALGAAFYLRASTGVVSDENGEMSVTENHIRITDNEIKQIQSCGDIAYHNPINYGYAKGEQLAQGNPITFIHGEKHTEDNNMGAVTALRYSALETDFVDEVLTLSTGRHITEADTNAILISSDVAAVNGLSVGDKIILSSSELGEADGEYIDVWSGERKRQP